MCKRQPDGQSSGTLQGRRGPQGAPSTPPAHLSTSGRSWEASSAGAECRPSLSSALRLGCWPGAAGRGWMPAGCRGRRVGEKALSWDTLCRKHPA